MSTSEKNIKVTCQGATSLALDELVEFQGGLKKLSKKNLDKLKARILEDGFNVPFFVWKHDGTNSLLDGHQRVRALKSLQSDGYEIPPLPVAIIEASDIADAKKKLLAISSQYGEFDSEELSSWLDELGDDIADTLRIVDGEMERLLKDPEDTEGDDDVANDVDSITEPGDVWNLGGHRLLCGDSTKEESVSILMGSDMADLWITDPPYNVSYVGKTEKALTIENDSMDDDSFQEFLFNAFISAASNMKQGAAFYIWHADSEALNFRIAAKKAGLDTRQCIIWNKNSMVMGRQDYQWKHEPCLYGWKEGAGHSWYSDRKQTTVIDFDRPTSSKEHPTMKPVGLFLYQIQNSSKAGDIVLDTFAGSGTTVIACEKSGRFARVMELDPHYCDVIVTRYAKWCTENGIEPKILRNNTPYDFKELVL